MVIYFRCEHFVITIPYNGRKKCVDNQLYSDVIQSFCVRFIERGNVRMALNIL
jgi:hypothetical protein